jgi:predicted dehydrogenase
MKRLLDPIAQPKSMVMVVNAGFVPADHWTRQPDVGGGRIVGEACHFIDLLRFLAGHPIDDIAVTSMGQVPGALSADDNVTVTLKFEDGSVGTVHYFANGHKSYPKERLEVFAAGRVLMLDNFRTLTGYGWPNFKKQKLWTQDKGHRAEIEAFIRAIENGEGDPIPLQELFEVTEATIEVAEQVGKAVKKARHVAP